MDKKRIIKKYEQLPVDIIEQVRIKYPEGFEDNLITFETPKGEIELALPFETDDTYYLIKMPKNQRTEEDEDFGDNENTFDGFDNFENLDIADEDSEEDDNDDD